MKSSSIKDTRSDYSNDEYNIKKKSGQREFGFNKAMYNLKILRIILLVKRLTPGCLNDGVNCQEDKFHIVYNRPVIDVLEVEFHPFIE